MKVYLKTEQDWIDFVNGKNVIAYKNPIEGYYKSILVSGIEIVANELELVTIVKKY